MRLGKMYNEELHDFQVGLVVATYYKDDQTETDVHHVARMGQKRSARAVRSEYLKERYH